jgi:L-serine dehydratase
MESISVLDIFKIGVGPSSSHTLGPWNAAARFRVRAGDAPRGLRVHLYGSLAKTGIGHGTHWAVQLGLCGLDYETLDPDSMAGLLAEIASTKSLPGGIDFDPDSAIVFHRDQSLPAHPNALTFEADDVEPMTAYSLGGGFIRIEGQDEDSTDQVTLPHPYETAAELEEHAQASLCSALWANEDAFRPRGVTTRRLDQIWGAMKASIHRGCQKGGILPGGLNVRRRAQAITHSLLPHAASLPLDPWLAAIRSSDPGFEQVLKWVSTFALAVNEENAAFSRVVTAPTNGAAGVIPSVLMYAHLFKSLSEREIREFLLVAGAVGILFKKGATISAAMGGCQAEIGVSSAMAAAGLTHCRGGSPAQTLMAAEIAMEHHLGMTCDPIGGLVQIPCIERNSMGAMKAITASGIALESDPAEAKVPLDVVIRSMWETALDMNTKYKETSEGGLAVQIPVNVSEC